MAIARHRRGNPRGAQRKPALHGAFGARIAALRKAAALTQAQLAVKLGVSRRQIAYYESGHGRPPGALLLRIADLFRMSTDALLGRRRNETTTPALGAAVLNRLRTIARLGPRARPRLLATLAVFLAQESARGRPLRNGPRPQR